MSADPTSSHEPHARTAHRPGHKLSVRAVVGISLIAVWTAATFTGILLYVAPTGRRAGRRDLLFGITKENWGDIHWWISLAAIAVTVVHVAIDWHTFRSCVRHLAHRPPHRATDVS